MKVLVTGGAGYVGSACLRHLLAQGIEAVAYDNLSLGHTSSVPESRLIVGDIGDRAALARALRDVGADAVMHFAASAYVGEGCTGAAEDQPCRCHVTLQSHSSVYVCVQT